jgi:hypothetical protein
MKLHTIDLSPYVAQRRKMRLLPNLIDYMLAYRLFRSFTTKGTDFITHFKHAEAKLGSDAPFYNFYQYMLGVYEAVGIFGMLLLLAVYITVNTLFTLWIFSLVKSAVLSDNTKVIIGLIAYYVLLFIVIVIYVYVSIGLNSSQALYLVALFTPIIIFFSIPNVLYLKRLATLKNDANFKCLVGIKRRSFAYASSRYKFYSRESLMVYLTIAKKLWSVIFILSIVFLISLSINDLLLPDFHFDMPPLVKWPLLLISIYLIYSLSRRFIGSRIKRLLLNMRHQLAKTASEIAQKDIRSPILFLRSFKDDQVKVVNEPHWTSKAFGVHEEQVRLEEVMAETLFNYGPLVGLNDPNCELTPLGAARENVVTENWQQSVVDYMEQASHIVFVVGKTENLRWEVDTAINHGYLHKCLFIFPPQYRNTVLSAYKQIEADLFGNIGEQFKNMKRSEGDEIVDSLLAQNDRMLIDNLPTLAALMGIDSHTSEFQLLSKALVLRGGKNGLLIVEGPLGATKLEYSEALRLCLEMDNTLTSCL